MLAGHRAGKGVYICPIVRQYGVEIAVRQRIGCKPQGNELPVPAQQPPVLLFFVPLHRHAAAGVVRAAQADLVAVEDRRGAGERHLHRHGQPEPRLVAARFIEEARRVMAVQ